MEQNNKDELYFFFKKSIEEEIAKISDELQNDIDNLKEQAQVSINEELSEEQRSLVEAERHSLDRQNNLKIVSLQQEKRIAQMNKKQELLESLFLELEEKLQAFAKSPEYRSWIVKKISLYDLNNWSSVQIDKEDLIAQEELKNIEINLSSALIGGFVALTKDGKTSIDESFKKKIKEARRWFYDHVEWKSSKGETTR